MLENVGFFLSASADPKIFSPRLQKMQVRTQPGISAIKKLYWFCQYNTVPLGHLYAVTNQGIFFSYSRYFWTDNV